MSTLPRLPHKRRTQAVDEHDRSLNHMARQQQSLVHSAITQEPRQKRRTVATAGIKQPLSALVQSVMVYFDAPDKPATAKRPAACKFLHDDKENIDPIRTTCTIERSNPKPGALRFKRPALADITHLAPLTKDDVPGDDKPVKLALAHNDVENCDLAKATVGTIRGGPQAATKTETRKRRKTFGMCRDRDTAGRTSLNDISNMTESATCD